MTRLAGYLWASPNTLIGLACTLGRCERHWRGGVLEATGAWLPRLLGQRVEAVTLGHVILARDPAAIAAWRAHERRHVRQYEWLGPLFLPVYFGGALYALLRGRHPYRDNPLERHAGL